MDSEQARLLLSAYRPGGRDAHDPAMREALELAARDPALGAWFRGQQEGDAAVARKLREVRPPSRLKGEILAGARLVRPAVWWRRPALLAVAAVLLACAGIGLLHRPGSGTDGVSPVLADFRRDVSGVVAGGFVPDRMVHDAGEARVWLASRGGPLYGRVPAALEEAAGYACKVLDWRGRKASMVCFRTDGGSAHLFVVDLDAMPGQKSDWKGGLEEENGLPTMAWTDARHAYVLVADHAGMDLKKIMSTLQAGWMPAPGRLAEKKDA